MYASLLGISGALYLIVFEQPVSRAFVSVLLKVALVVTPAKAGVQKALGGLDSRLCGND
jgi:hypothetical protein